MIELEIKKEKVYLKITDKYPGQLNPKEFDAEIMSEGDFEGFKSWGFKDLKNFVISSNKSIRILELSEIPTVVKIYPIVKIDEL